MYLDSNALIYAIMKRPDGEPVLEVLRLAEAGKLTVAISTFSYVEVRGYGNNDPYPPDRDRQVIELLDSPHIVRVEFSRRVALRARRLGYEHRLKGFDAAHLASAVEAAVDVFMSTDTDFGRVRRIEGVWVDKPYAPGDPTLFDG
ncbi:type II toxin-antitoxin system VapC family toxin [Micromonospora sp. SL1-18]|uniref:type II toxin-antitoxin system VapC family toxin n=1 Tax=Micromonospora sp. SL1-18 TaxID=3399128 RepID=UPI003A4E50D7